MIVILDCCFPKKKKCASKYHRTTNFEQTLFPQTTTSSCLCWSVSMAQRATCRKWSNQMLSFQSKFRIYQKPLGTFLYCLSGFTMYNFQKFLFNKQYLCASKACSSRICASLLGGKKNCLLCPTWEENKTTHNATCITLFILVDLLFFQLLSGSLIPTMAYLITEQWSRVQSSNTIQYQ